MKAPDHRTAQPRETLPTWEYAAENLPPRRPAPPPRTQPAAAGESLPTWEYAAENLPPRRPAAPRASAAGARR